MMNDDDRAMMMLEKGIYEAKEMLEREQRFAPFALIRYEDGEIEWLANDIENPKDAYRALYEEIKLCVEARPADIVVLLADTTMPSELGEEGIESAIRVHLEERSQQHKKIAGRFIYVPYQLQRLSGEESVQAKLFAPRAVSFPSEFFA